MARPRKHIEQQRERAFAAALVETGSWREAQRIARIHGDHVIRLMDRADFRCLAAAMLAGEAPSVVAVDVTPAPSQVAA